MQFHETSHTVTILGVLFLQFYFDISRVPAYYVDVCSLSRVDSNNENISAI